jgi:glutamate/tyrosine decarboxylase-like PLP-dependent enzyme
MLRNHITLTEQLYQQLARHAHWQYIAPPVMNVITIRWYKQGLSALALNTCNRELLAAINLDGRFYLTPTMLDEKFVIRIVPAQTNLSAEHTTSLYTLMENLAAELDNNY